MDIATLRSFRVGGFAVFDFGTSLVAMYWLGTRFGDSNLAMRFVYAMLPLSVFVHYVGGQMTPLTKMALGPGNWFLKLLLLYLAFIALK